MDRAYYGALPLLRLAVSGPIGRGDHPDGTHKPLFPGKNRGLFFRF